MAPVDVLVRPARGSTRRGHQIEARGLFRLARRDAMLDCVEIISCGAWGRIECRTGEGRRIFLMPSTFTGSFQLQAGCEGGILVEIATAVAPLLYVSWAEEDERVV